MSKNPFRARPEVQADVLRWSLEGRPVSEITNFLQEKYGKAYRKQNILEDMRLYQQKAKDAERARKAIPRKYRKEEDKREHILLYISDTRRKAGDSDALQYRPSAHDRGSVHREIEQLKDLCESERNAARTKVYFTVGMVIGTSHNLEIKLQILKAVNNVQQWAMIPTEDSARVLQTIRAFATDNDAVKPWLHTLQQVALTSRTSSFQKLVKRVLR